MLCGTSTPDAGPGGLQHVQNPEIRPGVSVSAAAIFLGKVLTRKSLEMHGFHSKMEGNITILIGFWCSGIENRNYIHFAPPGELF